MRLSQFLRIANVIFFILIINFKFSGTAIAQKIQSPEEFFGFKPGADRMLFSYSKLIAYLQKLDSASNKMKMIEIGQSPMGKPMYLTFISSENNLNRLDELKAINKRLALDPEIPESELNKIIEKSKVFFLATLSIHSTEVGPSQAFPIVAYQLLTSEDEQNLSILDNVVLMVVPNQNPDGMDMIVDHYNKYKGTKYEHCNMPGLYHKYIGHDNNRDFVLLTQQDVKNVARLYNTEWYPQAMTDKHQMGADGTRYFVPPYHDPIAENIEAGLWNWSAIYGTQLLKDMTADGLSGVSQHVDFDNYWPGSTETSMWKNIVSFLTEAASTHLASPIYIEPSELSVDGKGLAEYKKSTNMPLPWPGGWWKLSDIVSYEVSSMKSILSTTSANRVNLLKFRNDMCKKQVNLGKSQAPFYYILPENQHDKSELISLIKLMQEHGVIVQTLTKPIQLEENMFDKGAVAISLSQPYRAFIKEVMEKQKFPERHYMPDGELIKPYDITNWSLPLNKGLKSYQIEKRSIELETNLSEIPSDFSYKTAIPDKYTSAIFDVRNNESFQLAFEAVNKKMNVLRLTEDLKIDSITTVQKGSFVLEKSEGSNEIIKKSGINPYYIIDKKELKTSVVKMPRIALIETWFHDMDAGWARFVLDTYHIPIKVLRPGEISSLDMSKNYDVLILADENKDILMSGKYKRNEDYEVANLPPDYAKGLGEEGFSKIMTFVDNGGIVLSWGESTNLFSGTLNIKRNKIKEEFKLPFENNGETYSKNGLYVAGALLKIKLAKHPLTYGMQDIEGIFYEGIQVFGTKIPNFDMDRRIIATFTEDNIVMSGYAEKIEKLQNKPAMVWVSKGKGQFVFYAFSPTYRASTTGVYKLLFNALLLEKLK